MIPRFLSLGLLVAIAIFSSGCASMDESADDQMNAFHSTPENPDDSHGWGAGG